MGFSDHQMRALGRSVPTRHVRSRVREGKELAYVEGWFVLAQANRIFGFDGWDRETVETKCIMGREARGTSTAVYSARVRITVHIDDHVIVRDGHGTGEASGQSIGEVHDRALKSAETDATKRALATFGKAFGLALYAGGGKAAEHRKGPCAAGQPPRPPADNSDGAFASERVNGASPSAAAATATTCEDGAPPAVTPNAAPFEVVAPTTLGSASATPSPAPVKVTVSPPPETVSATTAAASRANGTAMREHRQRIDKSALPLREPLRIRDKEHLRYVASQPCLLCSSVPSDAHHIRFAQPRAMARKVGDEFTVPLCRKHHDELHQYGNEAAWWHDMGIDPIEIAGQLWSESHSKLP